MALASKVARFPSPPPSSEKLFSEKLFDDSRFRALLPPEEWGRLPVATWRALIQRYYPNSAWIRLRKDVFDQLYRYKTTHGLPTWDEVFLQLLQTNGEELSVSSDPGLKARGL